MSIKIDLISIISDATSRKASDIHFTHKDDTHVQVQLRIGGDMLTTRALTVDKYKQIIAFIKFHAALDLAHPMQPQSGSLFIDDESKKYNCRVSILPTAKFQSLVLRLINVNFRKKLSEIPYLHKNYEYLKEIANIEAGLILIGGPTGSGKTTTAYAIIDYLTKVLVKTVVSIEDPIEYQQPDVVQMQVNESAGMNYDVGIKEILRHDPDVIVIGEIRDQSTATQAVRAALTGHLVISTVHAKDILGIIHRMIDLGISNRDLQQATVALINQRLVRMNQDKKAIFEICYGDNLEMVMSKVEKGSLINVPYQTLDEELLIWKKEIN